MAKTKIQTMMRITVITQPTIWIAVELKALPKAKVAVTKAVFGKTKEYQVIENVILP